MRRRGCELAFGLAVASLLSVGSREAQAFVTTFGCASATSCTLAELLAGGAIQVNTTLRFEFFELEFIDPDGVQPDFDLIVVEGRDDGGVSPGDGIEFNGNLALLVSGADRLELAINFTVSDINANYQICGNSLTISSDAVVGSAFLQVGEFVSSLGGVGIGQKEVEDDPAFGLPILSDVIEFPVCQTELIIENDILLQSSLAGDSAELDVFEQRFFLPEPERPVALGAALLGLWALHHLRSRRSAAGHRTRSG